MRRLLAVALCASVADGLALRLPKLRHHRVDADAAEPAGADLRVHLLENDFEELDVALKAYGSCTQLVQGLMPIVGHEELVTRVVDRTHAEEPAPSLANAVPAQFEFEACLDLKAGEEWLAAHDVCAGYLERQKCEHEWTTATGILASICEAELEGGDYSKLDASLGELEGLHYACGCPRDSELLEPFVDLAQSFVRGFEDAPLAYGHALAAAAAASAWP